MALRVASPSAFQPLPLVATNSKLLLTKQGVKRQCRHDLISETRTDAGVEPTELDVAAYSHRASLTRAT